MIHVAPCSCELHVRIRELEGIVAMGKRTWDDAVRRIGELEAELARKVEEIREMSLFMDGMRQGEDMLRDERDSLSARAEKAETNLKAWRMEECWDRLGKAEARVAELEIAFDHVRHLAEREIRDGAREREAD